MPERTDPRAWTPVLTSDQVTSALVSVGHVGFGSGRADLGLIVGMPCGAVVAAGRMAR